MRNALMLIAAFKGKCQLGPMSSVDCEKAYQEGSNAAYEACAEIAAAALTVAPPGDDKARLDWLEAAKYWCGGITHDGGWRYQLEQGGSAFKGRNLREAIDVAMSPTEVSQVRRAIQCKYSCFKCGIYRRTVTVQVREDENVIQWLENHAARVMSADHDLQSPNCKTTTLSEVMIPFPEGTTKVGGLPEEKNPND